MSIVVDASVVVSGLTKLGESVSWAVDQLDNEHLIAPQHLPIEATNALFRLERQGHLEHADGLSLLQDLVHLPIRLIPFSALAPRIWELRQTVSAYDGWYVALAEATGSPLATIDWRLASAPGPTCEFLTPP